MKASLRAIAAASGTNAAITAFTLCNGVLMARMLGPGGRGAVFAILAYPAALAALLAGFVYPALARRAAKRETPDRRHLNGLAVAASVPLAALALIVCAAFLLLAAPQLDLAQRRVGLIFAAVWIPANVVLLNLVALDLGLANWRRYNGLRLLLYPLILAGLFLSWLAGRPDVAAIVWVFLLANLLLLGTRLHLAWRDGGFAWPGARDLRSFYREATPFLASSAATALANHVDQVSAALVLPNASAGLYAVAQRAGGLAGPLGSAAGIVGFVEAAREPAPAAARPIWTGGLVTGLVLLTLALAPAVWYLIPVVYGREFASARGPALLALLAGLFVALAENAEQRLEGSGRPLLAVPSRAAGAAILAAVALPLGLAAGVYGVLAGSVVGQAVRCLALARVTASLKLASRGALGDEAAAPVGARRP